MCVLFVLLKIDIFSGIVLPTFNIIPTYIIHTDTLPFHHHGPFSLMNKLLRISFIISRKDNLVLLFNAGAKIFYKVERF